MILQSTSVSAKKSFSRLGLALLTIAVSTTITQVILSVIVGVLSKRGSAIPESNWFSWVWTFVPLYAIGIPLGVLMMKKLPVSEHERTNFGGKNFFLFLIMCFPLMYGGSLVGTLLSSLFSSGTATNDLFDFVFDASPFKILVIVVLAPLLEEFVFRKQVIDRCVVYGEKNAILFSALAFGLFHMNLYQFFYAFGLGLVFAYVYTRTRKLRYSVIMHMIINFMGSVLAPMLLSNISSENLDLISAGQLDETALLAILPQLAGFLIYILVLLGLCIAGLVVLIIKVPRLAFLPADKEIPKKERFRTVYCNVGMALFTLFCVVMCVLSMVL